MTTKISIRLEGGIGDHLCAIRFLPAIRELYPDCRFYGFSDTENNYAPKDIIQTFWPSLFEEIKVIPNKKKKPNIINSQFGSENYIASFDNIPDDYRNHMINNYDKFYDLHIDGLNWMYYDFNWSKYFFQFLDLEINIGKKNIIKNQIAVNLYSDSNSSHLLDQKYTENLLYELSKKYSLIILATQENKHFYDNCQKYASVIVEDIVNVCKIIQNSQLFLTIDSGLKFLGYSVNTPTINFLAYIEEYGQLPLHQYIRWNPFIWSALPLNYNIYQTKQLIETCIHLNTNLIPNISQNMIDNVFVHRKFI